MGIFRGDEMMPAAASALLALVLFSGGTSFAAVSLPAPGGAIRDRAIIEALKQKGTGPCESLKKKFYVFYEQCVSSVALELSKPEVCDDLRGDPYGWAESRCVGPLARRRDDVKICQRIKSPAGKDNNCVRPFDHDHKWKTKFRNQKSKGWASRISQPGFPPIHQKECEGLGGKWTGTYLPSMESCALPATDSKQKCGDDSECQSNFCLGSNTNGKQGKHVGVCANAYPTAPSCKIEILNGIAFKHPCI